MLVGDLLTHAAEKFGSQRAIYAGEISLTFKEIEKQSAALASWMINLGIENGDRVIIYGDNSVEWIACYYAVLQAGAIVVPVNKLLTPSEVSYIADHSEAKLLIGSNNCLEKLKTEATLDELPALCWDSGETFSEILSAYQAEGALHNTSRKPDDVASICYTSGTTGKPKGAALTHRNILTNITLTSTMHGRNKNDTIISALPCPHVYGNIVFQSAFCVGADLVLFPVFETDQILKAIQEYRATIFEGVPTMYYYLLDENPEKHDLSSLRLMTVGGQSMPLARMEEAQKRFDAPLVELWGMTELAGLGTTHPFVSANMGTNPLGSIGLSMPGVEAKIADLEKPQKAAETGQEGELCIRGPVVMQGYWQNDAATRETIDADGWLATGDIATADKEGYIRIVDRKKDMILTAGYNIYPAEVEAEICSHQSVSMAAVIGEADSEKGEIPVAYVVLRPGMDLAEEDLQTHCRATLGSYKIPRRVHFVDDLPKTSSGKIMRRALKETA